jgi:hypothetical protein
MVVPRTLLASLWIFAACSVGEVPIGGGGSPDAGPVADGGGNGMGGGQTFDARVKPLVTACVACHQGAQPPNLTSFSLLDAKYKMKPGATNILVTKGSHQGQPFLTAEGIATVTSWIDSLP